ncbi:hypothetical protein BH23ACT9_BH23ACT9_01600 [soil metagenome]
MTGGATGHGTGHDRSGWGGALRPGDRPALVLIDMVRAYFDEGGAFELPSQDPLHAAARLLAAFRPEVAPQPGELVIVKQMPSAFFGTSLAGTLTAMGVDTVVMAGVSTSGCIRASATDAMSHGFIPLVVGEACGDRSPTVHDANLGDLAAKYAEVIDEATAAAYLTSV